MLNGELMEDVIEVEGLGTAVDKKGLLVRIDVMEAGDKAEVQMHMVMEGTHDEVVVQYAEVVVQYAEVVACVEVVPDEVVEDNAQVVADSVQAMDDDVVMRDEAIDESRVKVDVVAVVSQGNAEDV